MGKSKKNKSSLSKTLYTISLFMGLSLSAKGAQLYLLTFIDSWIIILGIVLSTGISYPFIYYHYRKIYPSQSSNSLCQSLFSFGIGLPALIIIVNFYFTNSSTISYQHEIIETGINGGRSKKPYAYIRHKGLRKKLVFKRKQQLSAENWILLHVTDGLLGFEVIKNKELMK